MQTITKLLKLLTLATFLFIGFSTQLFAGSVKTYYFNGMNTTKQEAKAELDAVRDTVKKSRYKRYVKHFNPILVYTHTDGLPSDALGVLLKGYKKTLEEYEDGLRTGEKKDCFGNYDGTSDCTLTELEYQRAKDLMSGYNQNYYGAVMCTDSFGDGYSMPNMNEKVQIISYSRGNIIANVLQDNICDSKRAKRTNIASPAKPKYGNVFTTTADYVIGKFTSASLYYHPYYRQYLSSKEKDRFRRSWYYTRKYNQKYFYWETPNLYGKENLKAVTEGHNLELCYLNKKYGLYNEIVYDIVLNYYLLGGK